MLLLFDNTMNEKAFHSIIRYSCLKWNRKKELTWLDDKVSSGKKLNTADASASRDEEQVLRQNKKRLHFFCQEKKKFFSLKTTPEDSLECKFVIKRETVYLRRKTDTH